MLKTVLPESASKSGKRLLNNTIAMLEANNDEILANKSLLEWFKGLNIKGVLTPFVPFALILIFFGKYLCFLLSNSCLHYLHFHDNAMVTMAAYGLVLIFTF